MAEDEVRDLVDPRNEGFKERVTPKPLPKDVFLFECPGCKNVHFRHAGYVQVLAPFIRPGNERRVDKNSVQAMVCTQCKKVYIWVSEQMYDVTDRVDVNAWERTEKEMQRATGPGGDC